MKPVVIISMTSIPARKGLLDQTIESLLAQTFKPSEIRLYAEPSVIVHSSLESYVKSGALKIIPARDRGPVTKLCALEDHRVRDNDIIVTVDDDIIYEPRWLETLVEGAEQHPDHAVGFCGWNVYDFVRAHHEGDIGGGDYVWAPVPGSCDVLEGWAGIAYRKRFFQIDPITSFASVLTPLAAFRNVDDVWIAWHLHRRGVPRATIHHRMARERDNPPPGLHNRPDFKQLNRDAAILAFGGEP